MKEMNISDELLSKFLEGMTDEVEDTRLLQVMEDDNLSDEDLVAIAEAAKLADAVPQQAPNLDLAKKQIVESLRNDDEVETVPTIKRSMTRMIWALAASAAIVIAVALFILFRPDDPGQNFAQTGTDSTAVTTTQPQQEKNLAQTTAPSDNAPAIQQKNSNTSEETVAPEETIHTSQVMEKQYAKTQIANNLTVIKPNKDNYRILCKNLEKSLNFEWTATNVQNLHFTVSNAQGKVLAELLDKSATQYALTYSKIYPERQLNWTLKIVFEDGTSVSRHGKVNVDYNLND